MAISEQAIDAALKRGQDLAKAEHRAIGARLDAARGRLVIEFDNGVEMSTPISLISLILNIVADALMSAPHPLKQFPASTAGL